jgi:hypothetical protein
MYSLEKDVAEMKKVIMIIAIVVVIGVGYFMYLRSQTPNITFAVDKENLQLSGDSFKFVFKILDPIDIEGYVLDAEHYNEGPFSVFNSTFGIVWGDTAIELASATPDQLKDRSSFSKKAQEVIRKYGCPADYLNRHVISYMGTADNETVDKVMRSLKKEDRVRLRGYKLCIESAEFEGIPVNFPRSNAVCITEATINGNHYVNSN